MKNKTKQNIQNYFKKEQTWKIPLSDFKTYDKNKGNQVSVILT